MAIGALGPKLENASITKDVVLAFKRMKGLAKVWLVLEDPAQPKQGIRVTMKGRKQTVLCLLQIVPLTAR